MTPETHATRWAAALGAPRDLAALVVFRVALGAIVLVSALRFLANGHGWIDEMFVRPKLHLAYWGFGWLPLPSPAATYGLFAVLGLLGLLVALGLWYRAAAASLCVVFTYLQLVEVTNYLNHYYLVSLLAGLMVFVPAHRACSLDARLRPALRADVAPAWCTWLLRAQIAIVYVNAGLAKATADWLLHAQPLNLWLTARADVPYVGPYLALPAVAYAAAWAGFLFDTTIVLFLSWRRARPFAYVAVLAFHLGTHLLFPAIGMFPVIMVIAALLFFEPSWPRTLAARLGLPARASAEASAPSGARWHVAVLGALFLLVQLAAPLRAHLYGGGVSWHEQGMRFSWRVMTRAKTGAVTFNVRAPASGREWQVAPGKYLTGAQEREVAVQPDLILQLAHHVARDFAAHGHPGVAVFADARASLNGRPAAPLIDPNVDLAREADGLAPKPWILPAPTEAPPLLRPFPTTHAWNDL